MVNLKKKLEDSVRREEEALELETRPLQRAIIKDQHRMVSVLHEHHFRGIMILFICGAADRSGKRKSCSCCSFLGGLLFSYLSCI